MISGDVTPILTEREKYWEVARDTGLQISISFLKLLQHIYHKLCDLQQQTSILSQF